jgi:hypothetical protein
MGLLEYVFLFVQDDYIFVEEELIQILISNHRVNLNLYDSRELNLYYLVFVLLLLNPKNSLSI